MNIKQRINKIEKALEEMENNQQLEMKQSEELSNNPDLVLKIFSIKNFESLRELLIEDNYKVKDLNRGILKK